MVNQIKYGAVISYAALFINILIGLVYTPWMINSIGKADYGLYTLAFSVIQIFVFDFGLSQAVTRFVAKYLAEGRQDKANQLIGVTYKLYLVADVVIFTLLVGVFFFIPDIYLCIYWSCLLSCKTSKLYHIKWKIISPMIPPVFYH